ncbi:hypothetical protein M422DRAFT_228749 [Sphaerobolus stellatus SS14]|uniref:Ribosome biogenesis protein NSA1 n=1 Tax=Sphaerobolus stellatus (strain SS14) TaxID=990650 RepID=A0A0C9VZU1_SPHS4|nr:hypothetical protein M422DRAFT_228749 [Sphaerobolus stellatus SS14]
MSEGEWKTDIAILDDGGKAGKARAIQRLAVSKHDQVVVAHADGSASIFECPTEDDSSKLVQEWKESRFSSENKYVGLAFTPNNDVISCTDGGHLRLIYREEGGETKAPLTTAIPKRLCEWVLSDDGASFAYGGDEVEVSVWDTSRAFDSSRNVLPPQTGGKRKNMDLIEGEVWRARNVANDFLNLRQPVHNTSLTFLSTSGTKGPGHHILAGSRLGSVRRYDTRAARRPVADWKDIAKVGGVKTVQRGNREHEAFVSDHGSNLSALDLRTGRIMYTYSGLAGSIASIAPTSSAFQTPLLASSSLDRFFRLHTAPSSQKGAVLIKEWIKSTAQCVVWDGDMSSSKDAPKEDEDTDSDEDVWNGIPNVEDDNSGSDSESEGETETRKKKRKKGL